MSKIVLLFTLICALLVTGCGRRLIFVTQSSIGLDISGASQVPNKVSLSYSRFEYAYVPPKPDGSCYSVYGGLDADMRFSVPPDYIIKQTFATGQAATNAAARSAEIQNDRPPAAPTEGNSREASLKSSGETQPRSARERPLSFYTGTKFGIHLSLGEGQMAANALIGYRRTEATVIPIVNSAEEVRPIYADIEINSTQKGLSNRVDQPSPSNLGGVRITQGFATGDAAVILSSNPNVQRKLREAAGADVAEYRKEHANQEKNSLEVIAEFSLGNPGKKARILQRAIELELVAADTTEANFVRRIRASPDAASPTLGTNLKILGDESKSIP